MWTVENRARYDRSKLRYPSDLTDQKWALAKPSIPHAKRGGNKRTVDVREVLSTGCQWLAIPKDLPPRSTVDYYFCRWQHDGTLDRLHHALNVLCREQADLPSQPECGRDRQSERQERRKGGGGSIRQALGGKKIKGKNRHALVDKIQPATELVISLATRVRKVSRLCEKSGTERLWRTIFRRSVRPVQKSPGLSRYIGFQIRPNCVPIGHYSTAGIFSRLFARPLSSAAIAA